MTGAITATVAAAIGAPVTPAADMVAAMIVLHAATFQVTVGVRGRVGLARPFPAIRAQDAAAPMAGAAVIP